MGNFMNEATNTETDTRQPEASTAPPAHCPRCNRTLSEQQPSSPLESVQLDCLHCDIHAVGRDVAHAHQRLLATFGNSALNKPSSQK